MFQPYRSMCNILWEDATYKSNWKIIIINTTFSHSYASGFHICTNHRLETNPYSRGDITNNIKRNNCYSVIVLTCNTLIPYVTCVHQCGSVYTIDTVTMAGRGTHCLYTHSLQPGNASSGQEPVTIFNS